MNIKEGDLPAFPYVLSSLAHLSYTGLTKREWLTGMVLNGLLASGPWHGQAWDRDSLQYLHDSTVDIVNRFCP